MDSLKNTSAIVAFSRELREAREFRRISLEEVSRHTCVTLQYLKALEDGDWEHVPAAYRRGYLALLAAASGMNREKVLKNYDALMTDRECPPDAVLDDSPSVLDKPQHKELTRAKIRTGWYTRLARHPIAFRTTTLMIMFAGFSLLYLARYSGGEKIAQIEFADVIAENTQNVLGASAIFPLASISNGESEQSSWLEWIGRQGGSLTVARDTDLPFVVNFRPYDTIKTQFTEKVMATMCPQGSVELLSPSDRLSIDYVFQGDTLRLNITKEDGDEPSSVSDTTNEAPMAVD